MDAVSLPLLVANDEAVVVCVFVSWLLAFYLTCDRVRRRVHDCQLKLPQNTEFLLYKLNKLLGTSSTFQLSHSAYCICFDLGSFKSMFKNAFNHCVVLYPNIFYMWMLFWYLVSQCWKILLFCCHWRYWIHCILANWSYLITETLWIYFYFCTRFEISVKKSCFIHSSTSTIKERKSDDR